MPFEGEAAGGSGHGPAVVALDVGGTAMKGALVLCDGTVVAREARATEAGRGPDDVVRRIVEFTADLADAARTRTGGSPAAAGLAVAGLVDERAGRAVYSANLGWRDVPLRDLVAARLHVPVALGHDIRAPALAEGLFGAGRGGGDFVLLPVGTGIAAAVVIDGRPYAGAAGFAGELGHVVVQPGGERCPCGQRGCLERYASAASVTRRYAAAGGAAGLPAEEVIARMVAGDAVAARVWNEALDALSAGIAACTLLLDPALVVLGGGLAGAADDVLTEPLRERVAARLPFREPPGITRSVLGRWAGALGAAVLAWRLAGRPDAGAAWQVRP